MLGRLGFTRGLVKTSFAVRNASTTIGGALNAAVERLPHKEALRSIQQDYRFSYKELNTVVTHLANGLNCMNFEKGDVLAIWLPNSAENLVTQFAAAKAGLTLAVIDPAICTAEEVEFVLKDSKARGLMFEPKLNGKNVTKVVQQLFPELETYIREETVFRPKKFRGIHSVITTSLRHIEGTIAFRHVSVNSPDPKPMEEVTKSIDANTPFIVNYTKSDGKPKKSAVITQGEFLKQANALAKKLNLKNTDKICLTGHNGATSFASVASVENNCLLVLPSPDFDQKAVDYAQKLEACPVVGSGADNFKRV